MSYPYYRDLWPEIKEQDWKYTARTQPIDALLWHATRGNQGYDGETELNAFINWAISPNNVHPGGYAGVSNVGIGPQGVVLCVPLDMMPRFSSWPSDEHAISIEVAQSDLEQEIEPATIEHCVRFAEYCRDTYGIPRVKIVPKNDLLWSGEAGHEDTVQGKAQGKSDPGEAFWTPYLESWEDEMTENERALLIALAELTRGPAPADSQNVIGDLAKLVRDEIKKIGQPLTERIAAQNNALNAHKAAPHSGGYDEEEIGRIAVNAVKEKLGEP